MSEEGKVIQHIHETNHELANETAYGTFQGVPQSSQPHAYQSVPGYAVADGMPVRDRHHHRLPCCGIGYGWFLNVDPREKPGYICCAIFSVLGIIVTVLGVMKQIHE